MYNLYSKEKREKDIIERLEKEDREKLIENTRKRKFLYKL